ncbi:hypothetical protein [Kitasatospora sp. NPDC047058]|uniref:HoxN/HupN/NixA family nickel/cobalt transporter n=1 Tax=Kitasatospora sp. NPDC047058 TaxID=3155620 RepID=UPI00340C1D23
MTLPETAAVPAAPSVLPTFRWRREDTIRTAGLMGVILAMHVVAFGTLVFLVAPEKYEVGTQVFGVGLGITAYTLGMRHAFDADHIAVIDNTTRKLMADGKRPVSVGFWFALGHSSMVVLMAALVAGGAQLANTLMDDESATHQWLGVIGTSTSGGVMRIARIAPLCGVFEVAVASCTPVFGSTP